MDRFGWCGTTGGGGATDDCTALEFDPALEAGFMLEVEPVLCVAPALELVLMLDFEVEVAVVPVLDAAVAVLDAEELAASAV